MLPVIIPARMKSTRFPGKPLVTILGQTLVARVANRAAEAVGSENVFVATDSPEVKEHVRKIGFECILTSETNLTGTDRVAEAMRKLGLERAINVQGDEPLVSPNLILRVNSELEKGKSIINCYQNVDPTIESTDLTVPYVVLSESGLLLYASRQRIPGIKSPEHRVPDLRKQVCVYGLSLEHMDRFGPTGKKTSLESLEDIEILRFLESGVSVQMIESDGASLAVDYPHDIALVENFINAMS